MGTDSRPSSVEAVLEPEALDDLIRAVEKRGFQVFGPVIRDGAIDWRPISNSQDLPAGRTANQSPGAYRLEDRNDAKRFGFAAGPSSLKRFLHEPEVRVFSAESNGNPFRVLEDGDQVPRRAFLGVRACDLAALKILDRVLLEDRYPDGHYQRRRESVFLVAVNCTDPSGVCFCESLDTGPRATAGFDLALTEVTAGGRECLFAESGTACGKEVLAEIPHSPPNKEARAAVKSAMAAARQKMGRRLETAGLKQAFYDNFEHPEWERIAARCFGCGNCTQVCPTCFCITFEDTSEVDGSRAERWRRWDSCFTLNHSYIHGGSVRQSPKSRYRQWVTHKLAAWEDQFGMSGCVGCGRCIAWCPAGIDITETAATIGRSAAPNINYVPVATESET
jgi:sulfhydrogenase subunit beta (sulfur reductase)